MQHPSSSHQYSSDAPQPRSASGPSRRPLLAASLDFIQISPVWQARMSLRFRRKASGPSAYPQQPWQRRMTVYVPVDFTEEVRSWIDEHRRLKALLQEISQLSLALVRSHAQGGNAEAGRKRGRVAHHYLRHFWPEFNQWLDDVPDSRYLPLVVYDKRFLIWWGISLYTCSSSAVAGNSISISMPAAPGCSIISTASLKPSRRH